MFDFLKKLFSYGVEESTHAAVDSCVGIESPGEAAYQLMKTDISSRFRMYKPPAKVAVS